MSSIFSEKEEALSIFVIFIHYVIYIFHTEGDFERVICLIRRVGVLVSPDTNMHDNFV